MIVKFSYKDEMYRSSNPPATLESLRAFLLSTFKTPLPQNFILFYIPDQSSSVLLDTEEDYQKFLKLETNKPVKVFIAEGQKDGPVNTKGIESYGIIDRQPEEVKVNRDEDPQNKLKLENLIENMSESVITSQVQKYPYFSHVQEGNNQDDNIRKIVRETIQEQMSFIIAQVKDAVLRDLRPVQPVTQHVQPVIQPAVQPVAQPVVQPVVQQVSPVKVEEVKVVEEPIQPVEERPPKRIFYQGEEVDKNAPVLNIEQPNPLLNKVKKFGDVLKGLPEKAKGFFEDWSTMGDPYIVTEAGKFQKSVVDKATSMKELFPEEELKVFLELINKYPRYVTLEQMVNVYLNKDEPQEAQEEEVVEQGENKEENGEKKMEIIDN